MSKQKKDSSSNNVEDCDVILSQQDYKKVLQTKKLYQQELEKNEQLQKLLQIEKQNNKALKSQSQKLTKNVLTIAKRLIMLQQENTLLQQQLQKITKKLKTIESQKKILVQQNNRLKRQFSQIGQFSTTITNKITQIIDMLQVNKKSIEQKVVDSQQSNKKEKNQQIQDNKGSTKVEKQQKKSSSISMDGINKLNFSSIEQSLNHIINSISKNTTIKENTHLQQKNKTLQAQNKQLTLRISEIQTHCQCLEHQMSSEINIRKVIETKYNGMKQTVNNNDQVLKAMQDLIKKYHQAIDNQYAKIVQNIINQQ